jgi:photosystem II stability/assembly factor-like uncharacterized protein
VADRAVVFRNTSSAIPATANDTDADGSSLAVVGVTAPQHGIATIAGDGQLMYLPDQDYLGLDEFHYTVSDRYGLTAQGAMSLTVKKHFDCADGVCDPTETPVSCSQDCSPCSLLVNCPFVKLHTLPEIPSSIVALALDPQDREHLYVATPDLVYASSDGAERFVPATAMPLTFIIYALALMPDHPERVLAATANGIFNSTDGAQTFDVLNDTSYTYDLAVDHANTDHLVAATFLNGAMYSFDGGHTFTQAVSAPSMGIAQQIEIDPLNSNRVVVGSDRVGVFLSKNGGRNFARALPQPFPGSPWSLSSLAIDQQGAGRVFATVGGRGGYYSFDGGSTFQAAVGTALTFFSAAAIFNPDDSDRVFVGGANGVARSSDGGQHFVPWFEKPNVYFSALAIDKQDHSHLWAGGYTGLYESTDGGSLFELRRTSMTTRSVYDIAIDPLDVDHVVVATDAGVFYSQNGGFDFEHSNGAPANDRVYLVEFDQQGKGLVLAGGYTDEYVAALWESTDSGRSFARQNAYTGDFIYGAAFDAMDSRRIYIAAGAGQLYKSTDGGATYVELDALSDNLSEIDTLALDASDPLHLMVGGLAPMSGEPCAYVSFDGGQTFEQSILPDVWEVIHIVIDPRGNNRVLLSGLFYGVYVSSDGGRHFTLLTDTPSEVQALVMHPADPDTLVALQTSAFLGLMVSTDGGASFTTMVEQPRSSMISGVAFAIKGAEQRLYVTATNGLYIARGW